MTTAAELREDLENFDAHATPGPWHDDGYRIYGPTKDEDKRNGPVLMDYKHLPESSSIDAKLIVFLRNNAHLLAEALRDAERLDFAMSDAVRSIATEEMMSGRIVYSLNTDGGEFSGNSWREAIDAARAKGKG